MSNKGAALTILLLAITIIAVAAGIYFYYQKNQSVQLKQAELDDQAKKLATYRTRITELEDQVQKLETRQNDFTKQLQAKEQELNNLTEQNDTNLKQSQEAIAALSEQLQTKDAEVQAYQEQKEEFETTNQKLTAENAALTEQVKNYQMTAARNIPEEQFVALTQAIEELKTTNQELLDKVAAYRELEEKITDLTSTMKTCETAANEPQCKGLEQQIQALTKQLEEARSDVSLQNQLTELTTRLSDSEILRTQLESQLQQHRLQGETLAQEREQLAAQVTSLQAKLDEQDAELAEKVSSIQQLTQQMETALQEKDAAILALQQQLAAYTDGQPATEQQIKGYETKIAQLQEEIQQYTAQINEYKAQVASLEENINNREAEYQQKVEQHNQMIAQLKQDIESGTMEKEAIQNRLQDELDRSTSEFQKRLETLKQEKEREIARLRSVATTYENLSQSLQKEIEAKTVTIEQYKEKLTVKIVNKILFASGRAAINAEGLRILNTVGESLKQNLEGRLIRVEGHTDNVPIGPNLIDEFPTNWELSTARAVNVVRYLEESVKIPAEKLFAVGYGASRPVADNETPEGRALNRRIEITLTSELEKSEFE